jgi:hypothetical protein
MDHEFRSVNITNEIGKEGNVHATVLEHWGKFAVLNIKRHERYFVLRTIQKSEYSQ